MVRCELCEPGGDGGEGDDSDGGVVRCELRVLGGDGVDGDGGDGGAVDGAGGSGLLATTGAAPGTAPGSLRFDSSVRPGSSAWLLGDAIITDRVVVVVVVVDITTVSTAIDVPSVDTMCASKLPASTVVVSPVPCG